MKVGDVIQLGSFLSFSEESAEMMLDKVSGAEAEGDVTFHGVKLGRASVTKKADGTLEVTNVV